MRTFEENKKLYAEIILRFWINLQKGQNLIIKAPVQAYDFVQLMTEKAYELGAKTIFYRWGVEELDRIKYEKADESSYETYPQWIADWYTQEVKNGAAVVTLYMSNSALFKDIDPKKVKKAKKAENYAFKEHKDFVASNGTNWTIASIPLEGWANTVYGNENTEENIQKLWNQIFTLVRIDQEDPLKAREEHINTLNTRARYLNEKKFKKLHYHSDKTNLIIELPEWHVWESAWGKSKTNITFCPNMPTEEVFSMPHKYGVNGTVTATLPLEYWGKLIKNFSLTFEKWKVVDFSAEEGYEILKSIIETDWNSNRLWEVAIVPVSSPIYQSGLIYYNTLFDENASCHLALWSAYTSTLQWSDDMTPEQRDQAWMNESIAHVDFMVGDEKLTITGETHSWEMIDFFVNGMRNI